MKNHRFYSRTISGLLLAGLLLTGCGAPAAESALPSAIQPAPAFFTSLTDLEAQYGFSAIESLDLSENNSFTAVQESFLWQGAADESGLLAAIQVKQREGLYVEFSFSQPLEAADSDWGFVFQQEAEPDTQVRFSPDGVQILKSGLPQAEPIFEPQPDWQSDTRYAAFLYRNEAGGLDLLLWPAAQPDQAVSATLDQIPFTDGSTAAFGLQPGAWQDLTMHALWKLVYTDDEKVAAQASYDAFVTALEGHQVLEAQAIDALQCEDKPVGEDGVFHWDALTNVHCDLSLQMGQALAFNFILANPANDWARVAIVMLDANLEKSGMPVKNLGLTLANDKAIVKQDYKEFGSYEYMNGFELEAGITYSAVILMNEQNGFEIQILPADNPDMRMSVVLDSNNVPPDWLPVENEEWIFGIWLPEEQQLTISSLYQFSLKNEAQSDSLDMPTEEATSNAGEEIAGEAEWVETGNIPNLGDFYITDLTPYDQINCDDEFKSTAALIEFPIVAEDFTHECQIDITQNIGIIYEFTYDGERAAQQDAHFLDFAISTGEGEGQKVIRFIPGKNDLILKSNDQFVDNYRMEGQINWEPGRRYTMIFIPSFNKYVYVWPSGNPQQTLQVNIDSGEWEGYFGADDPQEPWQLRVWAAAGIKLQMQNIYRFTAQ